MKKIISIVLFLVPFIFACDEEELLPINNNNSGSAIYVNPQNGSNNNSGRDINSPIKTLSKAGDLAVSGDTIYIIGGYYTAFKDSLKRSDQGTGRIIIKPYNGASVTLDGSGYPFTQTWLAILTIQNSQYITLQDLNIKNNSVGCGLFVNSNSGNGNQSEFIEIRNCKVDNVNYEGIKIQGSNNLVEDCEVSNACMMNRNFMSTGTHPVALVSFWHNSQIQDTNRNNVFRNNIVHDSWGEGIAFVRTDGFTCEGNQIYDCPYVFIYADNSYNGTISNNRMCGENTLYYRNVSGLFVPANGIFWAAEGNFYMLPRIIENINIYNNLLIKTAAAFGWFDDDYNNSPNDSYRNINIYHNTVFNGIGFETFYIETAINPQRVPPTNCNFKNNILDKSGYAYFVAGSDLYNSNMWTITNNCFAEGNIPTGFETNNIGGDPSFISPIGCAPDGYKLQSFSNCKSRGTMTNVTVDYWNMPRQNPPCIGFHEVY